MEAHDWQKAQKAFERMPHGDAYAQLSLGNIYFKNAGDQSRGLKNLKHA